MFSSSLPTKETAIDAKNTETTLTISIFVVAIAGVLTLISYGLSNWRSDDTPLGDGYPPELQEFIDAISVFTDFPDWWLAHALATYGEFVGDNYLIIGVVFGGAVGAIILIKMIMIATKS